MRRPLAAAAAIAACALPGAGAWIALAPAKTSHKGWPHIDGLTIINKDDSSGVMRGRRHRHNKLLGGHGDDTIYAGRIGDVLWGDYKPAGQPATQVDHLNGGAGKDFIYASHGDNVIDTGGGADRVHAHFGHGEIRCASTKATIFLSHRSRARYALHGCTRISYRTLGR